MNRNPWWIVCAAFLGVSVSFASVVIFSFGVFIKPLQESFGWTRSQVSLAFSIGALTVCFCSPFLGRLADRFGAKRVILPCAAILGLAYGSLAFLGGSLAQFYATYVAMGIVGNGSTQLTYSRIVSAQFDRRRGMALALVMTGVGMGAMVIPALAQVLIATQGWRQAYLWLAGLVLTLGVIPAAILLPSAGTASRNAAQEGGIASRQARRTLDFWKLVMAFFLFSLAVNGAVAHMVPMLTDGGLTASAAALAVSVMGAATVVGRLLTGVLLDRFSGARVGFIACLLAAVGLGLANAGGTMALACVMASLIGFGMGAEADVMPYLISRRFGLRSMGELYGVAFSAYALAGAAGPALMGLVFDKTGSYRLLTPVFAVLIAVSGLLLLTVRVSRPSHTEVLAASSS